MRKSGCIQESFHRPVNLLGQTTMLSARKETFCIFHKRRFFDSKRSHRYSTTSRFTLASTYGMLPCTNCNSKHLVYFVLEITTTNRVYVAQMVEVAIGGDNDTIWYANLVRSYDSRHRNEQRKGQHFSNESVLQI